MTPTFQPSTRRDGLSDQTDQPERLDGAFAKIEQFITAHIRTLLLVEDDDTLRARCAS